MVNSAPVAAKATPRSWRPAVLKSFSWVVLSNLARQISFLVVNAVLFERLSRSTFGAITLAFAYMTVFAGLGEFGIRQIGWRDVARWPELTRELSGQLLTMKTLLSAGAIALYLLMLPLLWNVDAPSTIYVLYGLAILVSGGTFDFPLFGLNRIDLFGKFSLVAFGVYLMGCLTLVTSDHRAWLVPSLFLLSMTLLLLLELLWFQSTYGRLRLGLGLPELRRILRESWSLGLAETLNRLALGYPLILIGVAVGSEGVGNYRIAEMGYSFLAQFGHMFAAAGFSHLSHRFQHGHARLPRTLARMAALTGGGAIAAGTAFALLGPPAFELVFGAVADETVSVLRLLGLALVFAGPTRFLKALLPSIDKQHLVLPANAAGIAVGAAAGWLAMTERGIAGMALAVALAELVTLLILAIIYRGTFGGSSFRGNGDRSRERIPRAGKTDGGGGRGGTG